jgi:protein involved in polysaccharide export with SLBB domain
MTQGTYPSPLHWLLCLTLACLAGCGSFEEKRIRELTHEKGFGSRAQGDATYEDYVGGLDAVQFLINPADVREPSMERLVELTQVQPIGIDGTIFLPYIGATYVLGMTELQLAAHVESQLRLRYETVPRLQARIVRSNKVFYAVGEVLDAKGVVRLEPDTTLMDAMFRVKWTNLANLGRVYLIRPDAENPLVIDINFREMVTSGYMSRNFRIRERDILYVPPTFLGMLARLLQRLLEPVGLAVQTMLGAAQIRQSYDILTGDLNNPFFFRF